MLHGRAVQVKGAQAFWGLEEAMWRWAARASLVVGATLLLAVATAGALQTTIGGRPVDLDTTFSVREVIEENHATKHERTLEELRLHAAVAFTNWLRFDSTTVGKNGGPTLKADRSGIYSWDQVFQDVSPSVDFEEAYVDVFLPSVDLRIGKQKVAWGKLDRTQPNDLINTLDYSDPFLQDEAERKIGVPALQASYYFPNERWVPTESRLTAVWVPRYIPYRFPLASCTVEGDISHCDAERWFPPAAIPPSTFDIPAGIVPIGSGALNPPFAIPVGFHVQNTSLPAFNLANSEIGLRYSALVHDVDFALYYFHGYDTEPAFNLTAEAVGQPDPNPANPLHLQLSGETTLSPAFRQIDSWGGDFAYAFNRFTVRGEGAFIRGRPFSRDLRTLVSNPSELKDELATALKQLQQQGGGTAPVALPPAFVTHDALEWGLGSDYVSHGYMLLLQVNQTDVFHNSVNLLIKNVDTRLLANLRKNFLDDRLETQLIAVHAIESDYTFLRPRLRYHLNDNLTAEIGYLFIAGRADSIGGQYRRNGEGWVRLEYQL